MHFLLHPVRMQRHSPDLTASTQGCQGQLGPVELGSTQVRIYTSHWGLPSNAAMNSLVVLVYQDGLICLTSSHFSNPVRFCYCNTLQFGFPKKKKSLCISVFTLVLFMVYSILETCGWLSVKGEVDVTYSIILQNTIWL